MSERDLSGHGDGAAARAGTPLPSTSEVVVCDWCGATTPRREWRSRFVRLGEFTRRAALRAGLGPVLYTPILCPDCVEEAQASA